MLVNLFCVMFMMNGDVIHYRYPQQMQPFECDDRAHIEASKMNANKEDYKKVEFVCISDSNFIVKYL